MKQVPITNEIYTKVETTQHDLDVRVPSMGDNPAMLALHKHNIRIRGYLLRQTGKRYKFKPDGVSRAFKAYFDARDVYTLVSYFQKFVEQELLYESIVVC